VQATVTVVDLSPGIRRRWTLLAIAILVCAVGLVGIAAWIVLKNTIKW
jgi:hypothetical protein